MLLYFALLLFLHTMPLIPCANGRLPFSLICKESEFQDVQQQTTRPQLLFRPSRKLTAARNSAFFDRQCATQKGILLSGRKKKISPLSATITNQDLATLVRLAASKHLTSCRKRWTYSWVLHKTSSCHTDFGKLLNKQAGIWKHK